MEPLIPYFPLIKFTFSLPDSFHSNPIILYGFGLCVGLGIIYGSSTTMERAEREGLDKSVFVELFFWMVFAVIVGGHIGYGLLYHPKEYLAKPELFLDMSSGLSSFGGFISFSIAAICVLKRRKKPLLPYFDTIIYGFSFGWIFGRLGCTLNHEHPGSPSNFWLARYCRPVEGKTLDLPNWMIHQPFDHRFSHCIEEGKAVVRSVHEKVSADYNGVTAVHDMGMYEMFYAIGLFTVLKILDKKPKPHGTLFFIFIFSYAPIRFCFDFLRPLEGNARYSGLTPAQWGCIGFLSLCVVSLIVYRKDLHNLMQRQAHS